MFVKPAPHLVVRIPGTYALLPKEGAEVPDNHFWQRRLLHGDVVATEPPAAAPATQPEPVKE